MYILNSIPLIVPDDIASDMLLSYIGSKQFAEKTDVFDKNFELIHHIPVLLKDDCSSARYCDRELYIPDDETKWFGRVSRISVNSSAERQFYICIDVTNPEYQNAVVIGGLSRQVKAYPWIAINPWINDRRACVLLSVVLELMGRSDNR